MCFPCATSCPVLTLFRSTLMVAIKPPTLTTCAWMRPSRSLRQQTRMRTRSGLSCCVYGSCPSYVGQMQDCAQHRRYQCIKARRNVGLKSCSGTSRWTCCRYCECTAYPEHNKERLSVYSHLGSKCSSAVRSVLSAQCQCCHLAHSITHAYRRATLASTRTSSPAWPGRR